MFAKANNTYYWINKFRKLVKKLGASWDACKGEFYQGKHLNYFRKCNLVQEHLVVGQTTYCVASF